MTKQHRLILTILMGVTLALGFGSLWLPYLLKLNIIEGDYPSPTLYLGYDFEFMKLVLFIMSLTFLSIAFSSREIISVLLSSMVLTLVWLLRYIIHFQALDHGYDSKTGFGFMLLFIAAVMQFMISASAILHVRNQQAKASKSEEIEK